MRALIIVLIFSIGCSSQPPKQLACCSSVTIVGERSSLTLNNKSINHLERTVDTLMKANRIYIDDFSLPLDVIDSISYKDSSVKYKGYELSRIASSNVFLDGKEKKVTQVFLKNHDKNYYLSVFYLDQMGIIIEDYSHSKKVVNFLIINETDTILTDSVVENVLSDTTYFPKFKTPPLPPEIID